MWTYSFYDYDFLAQRKPNSSTFYTDLEHYWMSITGNWVFVIQYKTKKRPCKGSYIELLNP